MERDLVLKVAHDEAGNDIWGRHEDIEDHFPRQDAHWDPETTGGRDRLPSYQEWVIKGMERAISKTINWAASYAGRQNLKETPSEFLDRLRDTTRKQTSPDLASESLLIGNGADQHAIGMGWQLHTPGGGQVGKMSQTIQLQIIKLGQEAGIPRAQALPMALLRIQTKPRTKEGWSPFESLYSRPCPVQKGTLEQIGEEL